MVSMIYEKNGISIEAVSGHQVKIKRSPHTDSLLHLTTNGISKGRIPFLTTVYVDNKPLPLEGLTYICDVDPEKSCVSLHKIGGGFLVFAGPNISIDYVGSVYTIKGENVYTTQIKIGDRVLARIQHLELTITKSPLNEIKFTIAEC